MHRIRRRPLLTAWGGILAILCLITWEPLNAEALWFSLTPEQVEEAMAYGRAHRDVPFAVAFREWTVRGEAGPVEGYARIEAPFVVAAHAAWAADHRQLTLSRAEVEGRLRPLRGVLGFAVTVLGPGAVKPHPSGVSLVVGGESRAPLHLEELAEEPPRGVGPALAHLRAYFAASGIAAAGAVTLRVRLRDGGELAFPFDLGRIR